MLVCILKNCDLNKAVFLRPWSKFATKQTSQSANNKYVRMVPTLVSAYMFCGSQKVCITEGCPIHPTRVDSSLVFVIRQTGNRFVNPIPWNWHESFPLLSIRNAGSRFVRDLENIVGLDFEGGLKILLIWVDLTESTRIVRIDWSLWPRFKNEEGSCIVISQMLTSGGLCRVGWKCCRLLIRHAGSRFARLDSVQIDVET